MIDKKNSNKIKIVTLLAMIMVIYLHSFNLKELGLSHNSSVFALTLVNINKYIQNLISQGLTQIAVPIFFIVSGFLFFLKSTSYKSKIQKRFHTLFIPYLFWAFLYVFIIFILQSTPGLKNYFNSELIENLSLLEIIYNTWIEPKNYPLWFLRDLIFLVLISPLISFFVQNYTKSYFIILLISWYLNIDAGPHFYNFKIGSILFFSIGTYLILFKSEFISYKIKNSVFNYLSILYFSILVLKTFLLLFHSNYEIAILFLHKTSILLGTPLLWLMLDRYLLQSKVLLFLSHFTFLFFVFQEPFLTIIKRGMYLILGEDPESSLFIYWSLPIIIMILLIILGLFMKRYLPSFSKVVTGNRL